MTTYFYTTNLISGLYYDINKPTKINESGNQIFIEDDIRATLTGAFSTLYVSSGINITFNVTLTSGEKNTLDTVITNHKNYSPSFIENIYNDWILQKTDYFSYRNSINNYYSNTLSGSWSSLSLKEKRLLAKEFLVESGNRYEVLTQLEASGAATKLLNNSSIGFFSLKGSGIKDFSVANINTFIAGGSVYDKIGSGGGIITGNLFVSGTISALNLSGTGINASVAISGGAVQNKPLIFSGSGDINVSSIDVGSGVVISYYHEKEVFYPTVYSQTLGDFNVINTLTNGSTRVTWYVPFDFKSVVSIEMIGIPDSSVASAGAGRDIDFTSDYAAIGQTYNINSQSDTTSTYNFSGSGSKICAMNIAQVFSNLAPGMFCGVTASHNLLGGTINYLGVRFRYK